MQPVVNDLDSTDSKKLSVVSEHGFILVTAGKFQFVFDAADGLLRKVSSDRRIYDLANGPRLVPEEKPKDAPAVTGSEKEGNYILQVSHSAGLDSFQWTIFPQGQLLLDYRYSWKVHTIISVLHLTCPKMRSRRWFGQGPSRVWKNRLKGGRLDVWQRDYNRGITGYVWEYPRIFRLLCGS